jgi:AcrR family transcriptional regulator
MPRAFSEEERRRISDALCDAGERLFAQWGIRRTPIDAIVDEVGIAKGSFYSFFASKEELYLTVAARVEKRVRREIDAEMAERDLPPDELVLWFLRRQARAVLEVPFFRGSFSGDDLAWLRTRVPPERFREHTELDDHYLVETMRAWRARGVPLAVDDRTAVEMITRVYAPGIALGDIESIGDRANDCLYRAVASFLTAAADGEEHDG